MYSDNIEQRASCSTDDPLEQVEVEFGEPEDYISAREVRMAIGRPTADDLAVVKEEYPFTLAQRESKKQKKYRMLRRQPATEYFCDKCSKSFKHPSKIAEHMRKHTKEKPFVCHLCGAGFTQAHPLKVHLRCHSGERPFKCSYCEKQFAGLAHAKHHEKVHLRFNNPSSSEEPQPTHPNHVMVGKGWSGGNGGDPSNSGAPCVTDGLLDMVDEVEEEEVNVFGCPVVECGFTSLNKKEVELHIDHVHGHMPDPDNNGWVDPNEYGVYEESGNGNPIMSAPLHSLAVPSDMIPLVDGEMVGIQVAHEEEVHLEDTPSGSVVEQQQPSPQSQLHLLEDDVRELCAGVEETGEDEDHVTYEDRGSPTFEDHIAHIEEEIYFDGNEEYIVNEEEMGDVIDGQSIHMHHRTLSPTNSQSIEGYHFVVDEDGTPTTLANEVEVVTSSQPSHNQLLHHMVEEEGEGGVVMEEDYEGYGITVDEKPLLHSFHPGPSGADGRVRVFCDPNPPKKGRQARYEEYLRSVNPIPVEVELDASVLQMAAPMKPPQLPRRQQRGPPQYRPAKNLDWIIDAVARGHDVDFASPHNRRKPVMHECEYCGKIEKYPSKIQAHMRIHTGEKPFKCDICGMGFAQRTPLRMHVRRHLDQKPFVCLIDNCMQRFVSGALLNVHQNSKHFGSNRRFVCLKGCGRSFANGRNQRRHEEQCEYSMGRGYEQEMMMHPAYDEDMYNSLPSPQLAPDDASAVGDDLIANMQPNFLDFDKPNSG